MLTKSNSQTDLSKVGKQVRNPGQGPKVKIELQGNNDKFLE